MKKNYTIMKTLLQKAKIMSLCALAFMATMSINAQTWSGATNSDFETATNWVGGAAPVAGGVVTIDPATNNPIVASTTTAAFNTLSINVGGSIDIQGSVTPSVANYTGGTITINGGTLDVRNSFYLGVTSNPATVTINSGLLNAKNYLIVAEKGAAVLNINGGTVSAGSGIIIGGYYAASTVNLNGGTLVPKASLVGSAAIAIHEAGKNSPTASGVLNIDGGTLVLGGDQRTFVTGYVNAGKIVPGAGKIIFATYDSVLNVTNVTASLPKKIAYLTFDKVMGTGASAVDKDTIIGMFNKDKNFALTVLKDDGNGSSAVDLSQYDLLIVQETFSSSANILKPTGLLGIKNLTIPVIYNKVYALKSGKGNITTTSAAADVTDLAITIPTANKTNPLFTGINFSGDDIAIFNAQAADDGTSPGTKGLQYGSGLELTTTGTCLATLTSQTTSSADTSVIINDIPGGTQFGTATTDVLPATSHMIAFDMNYGAIANANGTNITTNGLKLWQNAAYILLGQIPPATLYTAPLTVKENNIESISVTVSPNPTSGIVNINSPSAISGINVYDISGRKILSANKTNSVNLSGNTSGIYFIQIQTEAGSVTKKIIVK
jgi:hypothetical protein